MALYQATIDDKPYIMALYTEAIGSEGCTWNEDYPSEETMDSDLARGDAYVWKDETGEVLGAISIDDDHVVEELPCWSAQLQPAAEFARLVVREDARGQAIARKMILAMIAGCRKAWVQKRALSCQPRQSASGTLLCTSAFYTVRGSRSLRRTLALL